MSNNFITIDFETASRYEYSPCAVSLYKFSNGSNSQLLNTLINPGEVYFDPKLTKLHGISEEMVKDAPPIEEILKKICELIQNNIVFAHNAPFDISQIIKGCDYFDINIPYFEYADSLMIAKRTWSGLINYKLDTVCEHLRIDLNHHQSDSDAKACGEIIIKALEYYDLNDLDELLDKVKYIKGYYDGNWYHAYSKSLSKRLRPNYESDYDKVRNVEINSEIDTPISGKYIVFTGALNVKRKDAMELVAKNGGIPEAGITKKTNYLIVGRDDYGNFKAGNKSNKMLKAEKLIQNGQDLEILTEDDFFELISY